ncbi:MAG: STT3 domain-containing protein [Methanobacteriota archaeon]
MNYRRWLIVAYLLVMMFIAVSILLVPGQRYDTLTTSDSGWVYGIAEEISQKGGLVDKNPLSHAPYGWTVSYNEQLQPLLAVMLYNGAQSINPSVTLMDVVKFWGPLLFALSLIPIFLIGRELGGDFAGVAAVFFAVTMTSTIYWMKVGSFDREPLKFFLTSASLFFTIKLFKAPRKDILKYAILSGLSFGLFSLAWPGAMFFAAIPIGGVIFVLLVGFFGKLVRKFSDVFEAVTTVIRNHLYLLIGVAVMMVVMTLVLSIFGKQQPSFWIGFFQTMLGYVGIGGGGEGGVSLPGYASEAQVSGQINETLSVFYENNILTIFIVIMMGLALVKFIWSRKNWEIFVFAWLIVLIAMVFPGKGQARFVREWWPLVSILAGVGFVTLASLVRRAYSEPSLEWLKGIQDPIVVTALIVVFTSPFLINAYAVALATTPPTEWRGQELDMGFMESFNWLRENTSENSIVAIEWSYGHLLTGVSRRPTVADGVEGTGEVGKWENVAVVQPPDYIYTVEDATGKFLDRNFTINGRRTDVQRFPSLGSEDEMNFYFDTYSENYGVKIEYWVTHAYQVWDMVFGTIRDDTKFSTSTNVEFNNMVYGFTGENVFFDIASGSAFKVSDGENLYLTGVVFAYYNQNGGIGNPFNYAFREDSRVPRILWVLVPDWVQSPSFDQTVAIQSGPYYSGAPLYARLFEGAGALPDFMSVVYTSKNGVVKVVKISYTPSAVYPANSTKVSDSTPEFKWSRAIGATRYEIVLDDSSAFSSPIIQTSTTQLRYTPAVSLPDGTYSWRVGAYKGERFLGWSDTSTFVVDTVPPATPQLSDPQDGIELSSLEVAFSWSKSEVGAKYQVQIYDQADLSTPVQDNQVTSEGFSRTFQNNGVYQWRVRAIDAAGNRSDWTDYFEFTIRLPPQASTLDSPQNGIITRNNAPTFSWSGGIADNYILIVDDDGNFSSPAIDVNLGTVSSYAPTDVLLDENYSWKVVSIVGAQQESSPVWTFAVDTTPPEIPNLLKPDNGSILIDVTPTFSWSSAQGTYMYELVVARDQDFNSLAIDNLLNGTTFTPTVGLSAGTYYWRVYAIDKAANVSVSSDWLFTIQGG